MGEATFASLSVEPIATRVRDTFQHVLGARLSALAAHGGAVTGYIAGFSDFDFVVFLHGVLTVDDTLAIQRVTRDVDAGPFGYLQLSRVVDIDDTVERREGLIDDAYVLFYGRLPDDWSFHSAETLRQRGRASLDRVPHEIVRLSNDWAVANAAARSRLIRYLATVLKPAVRALLCKLGEPVLDTWRSSYGELVARLDRYDPELASWLRSFIGMLPAAGLSEDTAASAAFALLRSVHDRAVSLPG